MSVKTDEKMEISKIVVKMGKKEVDLSVEDARKLFRLLEEMFGEKIVHHDHYYPYWRYPSLTWYCGSSGSLTYNLLSSGDAPCVISTNGATSGVVCCNVSS